MPNEVKWAAPPSLRLTITTEIASLTNGSRSNVSAELDNSTNLDEYVWFKLTFTPAAAPVAGAYAMIYALPSHDGTNYPDGSSSVDPGANSHLVTLPVTVANAAKSLPLMGPFRLNPFKYKFIVENQIGQNWSSATLYVYTGNEEVQ